MSDLKNIIGKIQTSSKEVLKKIRSVNSEIKNELSTQVAVKARSGQRVTYNFDYKTEGGHSLKRLIWIQRLIIISIIALFPFYLSTHTIDNRYFGTTDEGRIIPDVELREPNIGNANLVSWVSQSITESLKMGFHDYNRRLRDSSYHYTRKGWAEFTEFLNDARIFRRLKRGQALMSAQPSIAPIVENQGVFTDASGTKRYYWDLRVRMRVTFISSQSNSDSYEFVTRVIRVPKLENGLGISIDSIRIDR